MFNLCFKSHRSPVTEACFTLNNWKYIGFLSIFKSLYFILGIKMVLLKKVVDNDKKNSAATAGMKHGCMHYFS